MSSRKRPEHATHGDPCSRCGLAAAAHRTRTARPKRPSGPSGKRKRLGPPRQPRPAPPPSADRYIGLDGEGRGRKPHRYVYAAAVDEHGELIADVRDSGGLGTADCLAWLVSIAEVAGRKTHRKGSSPSARAFGFALGYDLTKWLADLPIWDLWKLLRPDHRINAKTGRRDPVWWDDPKSGAQYRLDYLRGRLTVQRVDGVTRDLDGARRRTRFVGPRITVWDVFSFFGAAFVKVLEAWDVGTAEERAQIGAMKAQRAVFERVALYKVAAYCRAECRLLGRLVRKLVEEHDREGWTLTAFHGAGSSGKAMLRAWKVDRHVGAPPDLARVPVAQAFFGGRFEASRAGPVTARVWGYDLASAYPFAMATALPCLACGSWRHEPDCKRLEQTIARGALALVRCRVRQAPQNHAWGVFPWRAKDGTITYPMTSDGTWVWRPEYVAAQELAHVTALEAWVYETDCACEPFARMPDVYRRRVALGATAAGHALKLGANAGYGSIVQALGKSPFRSYVWGGMITSVTRAALLTAISRARDPWSVVMVATDAVYSTERLRLPAPVPTGTAGLVKPSGKPAPPLGGWDETEHPHGLFIARPGLYWDLEDETPDVRARGIGRSVIGEHAERIEAHWAEHAPRVPPAYELEVVRFAGAKSGVVRRPGKGGKLGPPRRDPMFGEWDDHRPAQVSFAAAPKRFAYRARGGIVRLLPWLEPPVGERESLPYPPALDRPEVVSAETRAMRELEDIEDDTGPEV